MMRGDHRINLYIDMSSPSQPNYNSKTSLSIKKVIHME